MPKKVLLWAYGSVTVLAVLAVLAGGCGMCLSLLHMSCAETNDIIAGSAGFVAGAVLVGSGTIALAVLSLTAAKESRDPGRSPGDSDR